MCNLVKSTDSYSDLPGFSDLNVKLDICKHTIQQQDQTLVEKERECVRRVQAAREEEFEKLAKVENEK